MAHYTSQTQSTGGVTNSIVGKILILLSQAIKFSEVKIPVVKLRRECFFPLTFDRVL